MSSSPCSFLSSNERKFTTYARISRLEMKVKFQVVKIIVSEEKSAPKRKTLTGKRFSNNKVEFGGEHRPVFPRLAGNGSPH